MLYHDTITCYQWNKQVLLVHSATFKVFRPNMLGSSCWQHIWKAHTYGNEVIHSHLLDGLAYRRFILKMFYNLPTFSEFRLDDSIMCKKIKTNQKKTKLAVWGCSRGWFIQHPNDIWWEKRPRLPTMSAFTCTLVFWFCISSWLDAIQYIDWTSQNFGLGCWRLDYYSDSICTAWF